MEVFQWADNAERLRRRTHGTGFPVGRYAGHCVAQLFSAMGSATERTEHASSEEEGAVDLLLVLSSVDCSAPLLGPNFAKRYSWDLKNGEITASP